MGQKTLNMRTLRMNYSSCMSPSMCNLLYDFLVIFIVLVCPLWLAQWVVLFGTPVNFDSLLPDWDLTKNYTTNCIICTIIIQYIKFVKKPHQLYMRHATQLLNEISSYKDDLHSEWSYWHPGGQIEKIKCSKHITTACVQWLPHECVEWKAWGKGREKTKTVNLISGGQRKVYYKWRIWGEIMKQVQTEGKPWTGEGSQADSKGSTTKGEGRWERSKEMAN